METKSQQKFQIDIHKRVIPQFHVRTGICSGDPVTKCQNELEKLQNRYNQLVHEARQRGISVP